MPVVAIDGPAGASKSTIAKGLARALGWAYLDSGAMYRAITVVAMDRGVPLDDGPALAGLARALDLELGADGKVRVEGENITGRIRTPEVTEGVSTVATVPEVRDVMVVHQRRFLERQGRIVAEGRDMGTVVFPDADVKIFLEADPSERARRRLAQWGPEASAGGVEAVQARIEARDRQDSTRQVAPLRPAEDAWRLDTSKMTLDEVLQAVEARVRSAIRP